MQKNYINKRLSVLLQKTSLSATLFSFKAKCKERKPNQKYLQKADMERDKGSTRKGMVQRKNIAKNTYANQQAVLYDKLCPEIPVGSYSRSRSSHNIERISHVVMHS